MVGYDSYAEAFSSETGGTVRSFAAAPAGGPCYIFATAGTYTVSVQFKSSAGSATVSNRTLCVQALPFA